MNDPELLRQLRLAFAQIAELQKQVDALQRAQRDAITRHIFTAPGQTIQSTAAGECEAV